MATKSEGKNLSKYWKLFASTFYLSAFTFGGGFVIVPLMKKKFVDELHWLEEDEMLNIVAIAQSSPGSVAVNASVFVGYRIAGPGGAAVTILGTILPPFIIIYIISLFYTAFRSNRAVSAILKGMQAGIAAMIADVAVSMGSRVVKQKKWIPIVTMAVAFIATWYLNINVVLIILVCGAAGALTTLHDRRKSVPYMQSSVGAPLQKWPGNSGGRQEEKSE